MRVYEEVDLLTKEESRAVIYKLIFFTAAMVGGPIGTYYLCLRTIAGGSCFDVSCHLLPPPSPHLIPLSLSLPLPPTPPRPSLFHNPHNPHTIPHPPPLPPLSSPLLSLSFYQKPTLIPPRSQPTGSSTFAGAMAAIMANVVLVAYVIVAMREDQSERLAEEEKVRKGE